MKLYNDVYSYIKGWKTMESNEILYLIPSVPHSTCSGPDESSCIKWGLLAKLYPAT